MIEEEAQFCFSAQKQPIDAGLHQQPAHNLP
jgi:hypothetical protein